MRGALDTFRQEMHQLVEFLDAAVAEEQLYRSLSKIADDDHSEVDKCAIAKFLKASTHKRKYIYAVGIITIYGALESFIRDTAQEYLAAISKISRQFAGLPERIVSNHTNLSINYLLSVRDGKVSNDDSIERVVERLAKCLRQADDYELNANAFTTKGQNVNRARVREIANGMGVELAPKRIVRTKAAAGYFQNHDPSVLESARDDIAQAQFSVVDDITTARNLISHGVAELSQIESPQILRDYIDQVVAYGESISEIFEQEAILHAIKQGMCVRFAPPIATYGDNIVCFALNEGTVRVGNVLVLCTNDRAEPMRSAAIESIQIENVDQQEVIGVVGCRIGIRVGFRVAQLPEYYLLSEAAHQILFA